MAEKILNAYEYKEMCQCEGYIIYQSVSEAIPYITAS